MKVQKLKDTKAVFINPFLAGFLDSCGKLIRQAPKAGVASLIELEKADFDVMLLLHLTGDLEGIVFFSMREDTARNFISSALLGMPVESIGELENHALQEFMSRTSKFCRHELKALGFTTRIISQIRISQEHFLSSPMQFLQLPFHFPFGSVFIHICVNKTGET